MSREIKFRAWDTLNECMVEDPDRFEVAGEVYKDMDDVRFKAPFIYYETWQDRDDGIRRPCHVMQYTGLKDRNGKEIYEGDILKGERGTSSGPRARKKESLFVVTWSEWNWGWCMVPLSKIGTTFRSIPSGDECEVIGNIHENQELLKP